MNKKEVEVVAAIIHKEKKVLATRRGYGEFINKWEFPGGKIERGESPEEALLREIDEELHVLISVDSFRITVQYEYPDFYLKMHCYDCTIVYGEPNFTEHNAWQWVDTRTIDTLDWIAADWDVVAAIKESKML